jgi:hypothetical protein
MRSRPDGIVALVTYIGTIERTGVRELAARSARPLDKTG